MELSDKDKELALSTKQSIRQLTSEISIPLSDIQKNRDEIFEKMSHITGHISDLCAIMNNSNCEPDLHNFRDEYLRIQVSFSSELGGNILRNRIERFCNSANSVIFNETKQSWFSQIQIRIKNITIFKNLFGS